ncbi:MAG: hypothetical protein OXC44_04670 [Proteobacteria bacterium]|nr:hypothetical protein [Pseudomonadota bacterium]
MKWPLLTSAACSMLRASCYTLALQSVIRLSTRLCISISLSVVLLSASDVYAQTPSHAYNTSQTFARSILSPWQHFTQNKLVNKIADKIADKLADKITTKKHTAHFAALTGLVLLSYHTWQKWVMLQSGGEAIFSAPLAMRRPLASSAQPHKENNYLLDSLASELPPDTPNDPENRFPIFSVSTKDQQESTASKAADQAHVVTSLTKIFTQTMADDPQSIINSLVSYLQKQDDYKGEEYPYLRAQKIQEFVEYTLTTPRKKHIFFSLILHLNQDKQKDISRAYGVTRAAIFVQKHKILKQIKELAMTEKIKRTYYTGSNVDITPVVSGAKSFSEVQKIYQYLFKNHPQELIQRVKYAIKHHYLYNSQMHKDQSLNYLDIDHLHQYETLYLNTQKKKHIFFSLILLLDENKGAKMAKLYNLSNSGVISGQKSKIFLDLMKMAQHGKLSNNGKLFNNSEKKSLDNKIIKDLEYLNDSFQKDLQNNSQKTLEFLRLLLKSHPKYNGQDLYYLTAEKMKKYITNKLSMPRQQRIFYSLVLHFDQMDGAMIAIAYGVSIPYVSRLRTAIIDDLFYMATHKELIFYTNKKGNISIKKEKPSLRVIHELDSLVEKFHYEKTHYPQSIVRRANFQIDKYIQKKGLQKTAVISMGNINDVYENIKEEKFFQHIFLSIILKLDDAYGEEIADVYNTSHTRVSVQRSRMMDQLIDVSTDNTPPMTELSKEYDDNKPATSVIAREVLTAKHNLLERFAKISHHHQLGRFRNIIESLEGDDISSFIDHRTSLHHGPTEVGHISQITSKDLNTGYLVRPNELLSLTTVSFINHIVSRRENGTRLRQLILDSEYVNALQDFSSLTDDELHYRLVAFVLEEPENKQEQLSIDIISAYTRSLFNHKDLRSEDKLRNHIFLCMIQLCDSTHLELTIAYELASIHSVELIASDLKYALSQMLSAAL